MTSTTAAPTAIDPRAGGMRAAGVAALGRHLWLHVLALGLATLAAYYGLWNAYFMFDDFWMLGWVRHRADLADAMLAQFGYGVRFLLDANLYLRVRLFDLDPAGYYWVSLGQHFVVVLAVYALARTWTGRRDVALITGLLFATTPTYFEVVTWITGSNYSLAAIPYLLSLLCFSLYLSGRSRLYYAASVALCLTALLVVELSLSLPLVLLAYHILLGRGGRPLHRLGWRDAALHLPYWILLFGYLLLQVRNLHVGSSEAVVAAQAYRPGLHMIGNLQYLVYLLLPPYGPGAVMPYLGAGVVRAVMWVLAFAGAGLLAVAAWRGPAVVRFALAFMLLTFLPFTLWDGNFAGAIRYRYLPAIGFSLVLAVSLARLNDRWGTPARRALRYAVPVAVAALVVVNVVLVQVWVQRHLANSALRRAAVVYLAEHFAVAAPGARVYLEVPDEKFADVDDACALLFDQAVACEAFARGERALDEMLVAAAPQRVYWLSVTEAGVRQVYPAASNAP